MKKIVLLLLSFSVLAAGCMKPGLRPGDAYTPTPSEVEQRLARTGLDLDDDSNGYIDVDKGGTNAGTAAQARTNLGVLSGTDDIDPDSLTGDTSDDNLVDAALLPDLSTLYQAVNTGVLLSTVEAAGDIIVGSGSGAVTRLPKGSNNSILSINNSGVIGWNTEITTVYAATFSSDDSYSGVIASLVAGETLAQWDVVYIKNKSGVAAAYKYDADGADKAYPPIGVAISAINADTSGSVLLEGFVRNDGWGFTTNQDEGKKVYASTTAGGITLTEPATDNLAIGRVIEEGVVHFVFGAMGAATGSGQLVKAVGPQMTLKHFNRDTLSDTSTPHTLTAAEVSGTIINNYSSSAAAAEFDLPTAASGYNTIFQLGLAQNVTIDPYSTEIIYLNGVAQSGGVSVVNSSPTVGESIACYTFQTGSSTWAWACKSSDTDFVEGTL